MILDSSLKVCFVMLENFCTFVTYYILEGRETCQSLTGIFYACTLHIRRFRTPVWSVNAPSSAIVLLDSGKGETVCILLILAGYLE